MNKMHPIRRQTGLSMVEVLVALVIFAFGLLGAAGLQLSSLKANQFSVSASAAVTLARDYGDMMRLMITDPEATATVSLNTFLIDTNTRTGITASSSSSCNGTGVTCSPADLAKAAIDDWTLRVKADNDQKAGLSGGHAEICQTTDPRDASGNLQWGGCDNSGDTVVAKMGWYSKKSLGNTESLGNQAWMTNDVPRMAIATFYIPPDWAIIR